jgi:hypothetical protein
METYTEVTKVTWWDKLKSSFTGMGAGILFLAAFPLLFWNEHRAVVDEKSLQEGKANYVEAAAEMVSPTNEGTLVHVTGPTATSELLQDPVFGLALNAVKLKRKVEMYQWKESQHTEEKKKIGGGTEKVTTYVYTKEWVEDVVDSNKFKQAAEHRNPANMPYKTEERTAQNVMLGAFRLTPNLVSSMSDYKPLPLGDEIWTRLPDNIKGMFKVFENTLYIGNDPTGPRIGDCRISFKIVEPSTVSVIARQIANTFEPYLTASGGKFELLYTGTHSAENMFKSEQSKSRTLTWVLRFVGFFLMALGLFVVLRPLAVAGDVIPILGSLLSTGLAWIAVLVAACCALITIGTAWIFYRPLFGIPLVVISLATLAVLKLKGKSKVAKQA